MLSANESVVQSQCQPLPPGTGTATIELSVSGIRIELTYRIVKDRLASRRVDCQPLERFAMD